MSATSPTIAEQVTTLQRGMATQLPTDIREAFAAELAGLDGSGLPATVVIGSPMPDGDLLDAHGQPTTLVRTRQGAPAVVVFYRGAWCPFCNLTLRTYQQQLADELTAEGVVMVAISPQKPDGSLTMQENHQLTYPVLSDPGNQIAGALGILTAPRDETRVAQAKLGLDVTSVNADGSTAMPMPTVALVDAGGTLRWIDVHPNYTTRTEPQAILAAVHTHLAPRT
ncbi:MAG: peroxiredoxin-like family protein [Solirubrobacteraceae bacterium]